MIDRTPRPCPYCWFVYYSKSALSAHVNAEHWEEKEKEEDDDRPRTDSTNDRDNAAANIDSAAS